MNPARKPALVFIFITLFLDIFGIGLIVPILPQLIESLTTDLSAASSAYGWLAALYALMQFIFAPILGSLSDRFGRRAVILWSLLGSGLDYLLLAFAPTLSWFFVGRIVAGITGANFAAASAYIADVSPPEKRAANFGIIGAAFGLGFILGPALGGWLGSYGLRVPFYAAAGMALLNWLYGVFVLPESLPADQRRAFSWARSNPVGSLLALNRYPVVVALAATYFLANLAHQVFPSTWVLYTTHRYNWTSAEVGWSLAAVGLMAALVQGGLARRMIPALGERRAIMLGLLNGTVFLTLYGLATQSWMVYGLIFFGAFGGIAMPAIQGVISRQVPLNEQGGLQGALTSLGSVAGFVGPLVFTALFGHFVHPQTKFQLAGAAFFAGSAIVGVALLLAIRSFRRNPPAS